MNYPAIAVTVSLLLLSSVSAEAQSRTNTRESITLTGTVEAIDASSRTLSVKAPDGEYETLRVPEEAKRFSEIKVGDKVSLRYYDNVIFRVQNLGEPNVDTEAEAATPAAGGNLAGTLAVQRTITAVIEDVDRDASSVTLTGPNGWRYSSRVRDKKLLDQLEVGRKVNITWTEAALISIEKAEE